MTDSTNDTTPTSVTAPGVDDAPGAGRSLGALAEPVEPAEATPRPQALMTQHSKTTGARMASPLEEGNLRILLRARGGFRTVPEAAARPVVRPPVIGIGS